ncbi:hypothetical protein NC652_028835 [Populus alba x Populus x berolinensis]|uniref:Plant heme peroxidase family profile domain-containing protein n=1 Tax=Populus alba x Populus x berolinensis TaxID=444605 RepID=A0AAD6Q486_9ROSI|nr:hypothetical protein NC652_028835 [Populus alba x Populus x berolinensis]KAJ6976448.1 hypothetical protein NC653_028549 [Populus alba x Populus x berolinensis]
MSNLLRGIPVLSKCPFSSSSVLLRADFQLTQRFSEKGFTQEEMVHSLDPSLDSTYAASLKQSCSRDSTNPNLEVPVDTRSPTVNDANYYRDILANP